MWSPGKVLVSFVSLQNKKKILSLFNSYCKSFVLSSQVPLPLICSGSRSLWCIPMTSMLCVCVFVKKRRGEPPVARYNTCSTLLYLISYCQKVISLLIYLDNWLQIYKDDFWFIIYKAGLTSYFQQHQSFPIEPSFNFKKPFPYYFFQIIPYYSALVFSPLRVTYPTDFTNGSWATTKTMKKSF